MKKQIAYTLITFTMVFLYSCGTGNPTEKMGEKAFKENYKSDFLEIADFKKINGIEKDFGEHYYEMKCAVKYTAKQNFHEYLDTTLFTEGLMYALDSSVIFKEKGIRSFFTGKLRPIKFIKALKKGDFVRTDTVSVVFLKTENGWEKTK